MKRKDLFECIQKGNRVRYDGSYYVPMNCIIGFSAGKWTCSATLKDLNHFNSTIIAPLERIELI